MTQTLKCKSDPTSAQWFHGCMAVNRHFSPFEAFQCTTWCEECWNSNRMSDMRSHIFGSNHFARSEIFEWPGRAMYKTVERHL